MIPGRDTKRLGRLPYWILLFKTPFLAAFYQSRLRWYHRNAVENLPVNPLKAALTPGRGLTPPLGYIDPETGEDIWKRLHEYCLLQPAQNFSVTALQPDFPPSIEQAIQGHRTRNDFGGAQSWTVLVRIDGGQLNKDQICKFLEEDGNARNRPWGTINHRSAGMTGYEQLNHVIPRAVCEGSTGWQETEKSHNFGIRFESESEAMRFWRTWHRRPIPHLDACTSDYHALCLHVELTW